MDTIAPWEADLIVAARYWLAGPEGRAEVWNGFARSLGPAHGRTALKDFETLMTLLGTHARRPLARHGLKCTCIGSDEAVLRMLVSEAARGDLAEAALIASLLVSAAHAEAVAWRAAPVGRTMQRMARRPAAVPTCAPGVAQPLLH